MNKNHYLKQLKNHFKHMNKQQKEDILNQYHTHFYTRQQQPNSQSDLCKQLPNPKLIAN
ncbi:HAAS signaling domain-containing protein, partial [Staphylococcus epidermidis]|uniref:HAAS signaling domain-containing protein n=1 Tax=Staphylococcus epidermidis TaxID=1282 RepID=UPI0011A59FE2